MQQYLNRAIDILNVGKKKPSGRAGMPDTLAIFGEIMRFDLLDGFPIMTTKKVGFKNILTELLWMLRGSFNIQFLVENGCNIWNKDAYRWYKQTCSSLGIPEGEMLSEEDFVQRIKEGKILPPNDDVFLDANVSYGLGDLGPVYGKQWRAWWDPINKASIDQISDLITKLRKNPFGRRNIVSAWNVPDVPHMALPPCHLLFQFHSRPATKEEKDRYAEREDVDEIPDNALSCSMYQRSCDFFLGVPYNITSYALLTEIISRMTDHIPNEFIWMGGDVHLYENHIDAIKTQLEREPRDLPRLVMSTKIGKDLPDPSYINLPDIELEGYNPHPRIKAKLSVGTEN